MPTKNKKRIIFVMGSYRSGTSVITKGLSTLGVRLTAPLLYFPPHNPKGDWEDIEFQNFNSEILNEIIALTNRSRSILLITEEEIKFLKKRGFVERAIQLLSKKLSDSEPLGLKYPMISILLPFWKEVCRELNLHISCVIALRDPKSVAASITEFTQEPLRKSFCIWISFLLNALEHSEGYPRVLVDYQELLKNPTMQIKRVAQALVLDVHQELLQDYINNFIDPTLCHFKPDCTVQNEENGGVGKQEILLENDICGKLSNEMYQQLFAVAKDHIAFEDLQKSFEKWKNQFLSAQSFLQLVEESEFFFNQRHEKFEQRVIKELHKIKNAFDTSVAEKINLITELRQLIHQRDNQLMSLMEERVGQ